MGFPYQTGPRDPSRLYYRGTGQRILGQVRFDSTFGSYVVNGPCSIPGYGSVLFSALEAGYQPFCGAVAKGNSVSEGSMPR